MRILPLPPEVANQIAAGEVIERPASIVKELLENSLDAGADTIHIDIGYGGLNQIKISDNGSGIVTDDLPLAIAAHATSKISQFNDLYALASMGFRGEALASISSIARLSISSKPDNQETGSLLQGNAQQFTIIPCARARGTTIDVKDIFYNAPVRKKFLKSERTEYQAIDSVVKRFALSAPEITISLSHNGKLQRHLPAALSEQSRMARISKILGKSFVEQAIYLEVTHADMRLQGWTSSLTWQRSQSDLLWVYVNHRMVRDKLINHAIKQAYDSLLYPGRNPACLLYLSIQPALVDVNVHPTKHEVRFQEPRLVHDFISSQLRQVVQPESVIIETNQNMVSYDYQVREAAVAPAYTIERQPSLIPPITNNHQASAWVIVNQRFALLSLNNQSSLVDLKGLQAHLLRKRLQQAQKPLASRPLLVPVYIEHLLIRPDHYLLISNLLLPIGIHLDYVSEGRLVIRSLPVIVPDLAIKAFLIRCFTTLDLSESIVFDYLIDNQTATLLSAEQLDECYAYLIADSDRVAHQFIKPLSEQVCQDFFDAK